jgi:hypothetical protein
MHLLSWFFLVSHLEAGGSSRFHTGDASFDYLIRCCLPASSTVKSHFFIVIY